MKYRSWGEWNVSVLRELDRRIVTLFARYDSLLEYQDSLFVPEHEGFDQLQDDIEDVRWSVDVARRSAENRQVGTGPESAGPVASGALADVLFGHWYELLDLLEARIRDDQAFPYRFVRGAIGKTSSLISLDSRVQGERLEAIARLYQGVPAVLDAAGNLAVRLSQPARQQTIDMLSSVSQLAVEAPARIARGFAGLPEGHIERACSLIRESGAMAQQVSDRIRAAALPGPARMYRGLTYADTLRLIYGIELDELVAWHRDEVEGCRERFSAVARAIDPNRDPLTILEQDLGPYSTAEEMLEAGRRLVPFCREKALEYVSLPDGEVCEVWETPEHLRDTYPWGGYWGGNTLDGELHGAVFLNRWNYRAVTRGWVELNAVHECYPGHHAHAVKTAAAKMPLTFKVATLTARSSPHTEGIAHKSETLMQDIFNDAFPLFVAFRKLHTSVRIWADLEMFHWNHGREAAVQLYMNYLGLDRATATGQAKSQEITPGYFTIYYYGMKALEQLQEECGWNDRDFTELVFSAGKVSLRTVRRLVHMPAVERRQLLEQFNI